MRTRSLKSPKLKERPGMYPEQFYLLQKGDVVRMVRSRAPRLILGVSRYHGETRYIELQKLRPSWTRGNTTLMDANNADLILPVKVRDGRIWDLTYEVIIRQREKAYRHFANLAIRRALKRVQKLTVKKPCRKTQRSSGATGSRRKKATRSRAR